MRNILLWSILPALLFSAGCSDTPAPGKASPELKAREAARQFRCSACRKTAENREIERKNQTVGRCPHCRKTVPMIPLP